MREVGGKMRQLAYQVSFINGAIDLCYTKGSCEEEKKYHPNQEGQINTTRVKVVAT